MLLHLTTGLVTIADNTTMTMLYPLVLTGVNAVEFLAIRMIDIWKESVEQAKESSRKEKSRKKRKNGEDYRSRENTRNYFIRLSGKIFSMTGRTTDYFCYAGRL